ncbi:MAG: PAS domain S-box protein [Burkholderiales bacterium]|nr:PAS domain S-box protein [Burkholderiales bacterium]MDE2277110.1 PAS domain S-box protein [Burkholderiales bacterium]
MSNPSDEAQRLQALHAYGVLDTPPEPELDRLTGLLARLCNAPIATVSLIDIERQWFKSVHGVDWRSTARAQAFCGHTIEQRGLLLVEDAATDLRFATHPLVVGDEALRFYAGVPLLTPEGLAIGAVAVLDRVPRSLSPLQREALQTLADQVMLQLESRRRRRMLEDTLLQRERAHAEQRESEARWRLLFERHPVPMWIFDQQTHRILVVNDAAVEAYGWSREEFAAMTLHDIRPPEDRPALEADLAEPRHRLHGGQLWRHRRKDGSVFEVEIRAHSLDFGGRPGRLVQAQDVSERVQGERRLREQAALLDEARDAIVVRSLDDRITYWSRGAERVFGWTAAEAHGAVAWELLGESPAQVEAERAEVLARGEAMALMRRQRKDGSTLVADCRCTLLRDAQGRPAAVLTINTDVTQRLALEAQLQQAQRLEAVGQLTGGVAHDFNNLLTVILGNADLLAEQLAGQPALQALAEMARTAAERGAELTQRLLAFARRQALQPQAVDTHQRLAGMDALLRRTLPENIELELVRGAGLWPAMVDPVQLESALLNLVLNARDAMPQGGKITLETANAWIDQDYAERHADVLPGQYVLLSVSDTGAGMTPAQLARAFEPFYTTKGVGQGSGLGLSMVYGFVKQSRGHVKLYSEIGHGTTARLYLPRADGTPADAGAAAALPAGPDLRGHACVLVVEDDALVRRHAAELLRGLGYTVLDAEHGPAALAVLRERDDIDLLFTDVVMPGGLNGRQLADAALALRPGLKVLFTSGYTENAIVHHGRLDRGVHLLPKPYRSVDLARKVHAVLRTALP